MDFITNIDPIFLLAIPAFAWQGWYNQRRRDVARAAAMRRHTSRRG